MGAGELHETWQATSPTSSSEHGPFSLRASAQLLFGAATVSLEGDIAAITRDIYRQMFASVQACGVEHLLRIWHFLPAINDGVDDRERYKQFCVGRALAFDEHPSYRGVLPAGTAIGSLHGNELLIYFLAARTPGLPIENPRQVSAFAYPRQYGPRQPLFSRALAWPRGNPTRLIVSGTASIVGHESRHADDLQGQLAELWRNLECLRERAGASTPLALRAYIRRNADYHAIRAFLAERLPEDAVVLYLQADICRAELLVEIEGIYAMPGA